MPQTLPLSPNEQANIVDDIHVIRARLAAISQRINDVYGHKSGPAGCLIMALYQLEEFIDVIGDTPQEE